MSQLVSVPRRTVSRLKPWVACSLGIVLLFAMLFVVGSRPALASTRTTNSWSIVAPMPTARAYLAASLGLDGRIYAIGGYDGVSNTVNTVEAYNSKTNSWSTVAPMPTARYGLAASLGRDGRIYAIGGADSNDNLLNTVEAYTP